MFLSASSIAAVKPLSDSLQPVTILLAVLLKVLLSVPLRLYLPMQVPRVAEEAGTRFSLPNLLANAPTAIIPPSLVGTKALMSDEPPYSRPVVGVAIGVAIDAVCCA